MLVKLTEVCVQGSFTSQKNNYALREIFVNPEHVVMIREEATMRRLNEQTSLVDGLDSGHSFSKVTLDRGQRGEVVVVGSPDAIRQTLNQSRRQVIRG